MAAGLAPGHRHRARSRLNIDVATVGRHPGSRLASSRRAHPGRQPSVGTIAAGPVWSHDGPVTGSWEHLRPVLGRLRDDPAAPLRRWPDPDGTGAGGPPFSIRLAAWAVDVAAELDQQFGPDVELRVGFLRYPPSAQAEPTGVLALALAEYPSGPPCPDGISAAPTDPIAVRSGHDVRTTLIVHNAGTATTHIRTNGTLTAMIVDPAAHRIVGSYAGSQTLPLVSFELVPGADARVPLLVGTASIDPHLGFAVPPGEWAYIVELDLEPGGRCWLPEAPVSILT